MNLLLTRIDLQPSLTIGTLAVDGQWECWTLEDQVRDGPKVPGATAIPFGHYTVSITPSQRFKRDLPLLLKVPGFEGIRIHPGNVAADTEGCILVGCDRLPQSIGRSRAAFDALFAKLNRAYRRGEAITIDITR